MASRFLATFEVEVTTWQKALAMVADVMVILNDIQRTWSYLEPLFVGSEEVKRELPDTAEKFAGIDMDVKGLLAEALATKNIRTACNRAGLYEELERLLELLEQCKVSVATGCVIRQCGWGCGWVGAGSQLRRQGVCDTRRAV